MSESLFIGYLISKMDYQTFDEIITFITPVGERISCISMGSRKITSKNARNLFIGSRIEFEIFKSRAEDKLGKLKKAHMVEVLDWNYETLEPFNLLNELVKGIPNFNKETYKFYEFGINLIKQKKDDQLTNLIILRNYCRLIGVHLEVNKCIRCGNHRLKTISFKEHGMVCNLCFDHKKDEIYELNVSKIFHYLFNNQYDKLISYTSQLGFVIVLLKEYVQHQGGIYLNSLKNY